MSRGNMLALLKTSCICWHTARACCKMPGSFFPSKTRGAHSPRRKTMRAWWSSVLLKWLFIRSCGETANAKTYQNIKHKKAWKNIKNLQYFPMKKKRVSMMSMRAGYCCNLRTSFFWNIGGSMIATCCGQPDPYADRRWRASEWTICPKWAGDPRLLPL